MAMSMTQFSVARAAFAGNAKVLSQTKAQPARARVASVVRAVEDKDMSLDDIIGVTEAADASISSSSARPSWAPGSKIPAYLDGSMVGDFGYDPLGLAKAPGALAYFRECEVINGRWAMLGTAGILAQELTGQTNWVDYPKFVFDSSAATYLGNAVPFDFTAILAFQLVAMGLAEGQRASESDPEKRLYPGGAFDPMGFAKGDLDELKLKEIKNGRLAMFSIVGYYAQAYCYPGEGPIANWQAHIADPWGANLATNGISLPWY